MSLAIFGKNAVRAAINAGEAERLLVSPNHALDEVATLAKKLGIPVEVAPDKELEKRSLSKNHQGYVAFVKPIRLHTLEELIADASKKTYPLLLLLDGIEDPHNLGAILRSADAFGVDGVIMKKRGEVPLNGTVAKVSTGAIHHVKVAAVANLSQAILTLQKAGYWIVASADKGAQNYTDVDYRSPIGLIVGSEGKGVSPLVLKNSDFIVRIPMHGSVNCLNASVATGILLANIVRQRA